MRCYILFYRNKKGDVKAYPNVFFSAEHCLNTGEDLMDKEKWIDYGYRIVDPPELAINKIIALKMKHERIKRYA